ncbi:MAG: hypothetical protein K2K79_06715 [Paramuribaculum sp.]|nr:hypothetical protein [Paramuribaculum sp.]
MSVVCLLCCVTDSFAKPKEYNFELTCSAKPDLFFRDLPQALVVTASSSVANDKIFDASQLHKKFQKLFEDRIRITYTPSAEEFVEETVKRYARSSGIDLGYDRLSDFTLKVNLKELKFVLGEDEGYSSAVLEWSLYNPEGKLVLDGTSRGRQPIVYGTKVVNVIAKFLDKSFSDDSLDKAYSKALAAIDWEGISRNLSTDARKKQEQTQVTGTGNTELEHTIIRWYILSNPSGADVSWRVVSSTPDVRNTNANFVGTTPYESTESFDIKGLTAENAGNVQIEVTCERAGYLPQKKRFNLRQAIDQKEISAKFNLVKESDE